MQQTLKRWVLAITVAVVAVCNGGSAIVLPDCPVVPIEYFTSQLCGSSRNTTIRKVGNETIESIECSCDDNVVCMCPRENGIAVESFDFEGWVHNQTESTQCIDDFNDPEFTDYPYEYHCQRDCVLTSWSYETCISGIPGCDQKGQTTRTRGVAIPSNGYGTCTRQPLLQESNCVNAPCFDTFLVEATVIILSDTFEDILRAIPITVIPFATENITAAPNGRYLSPITAPRKRRGLLTIPPKTTDADEPVDRRNAIQLFFGVRIRNRIQDILEMKFVLLRTFGARYLNIPSFKQFGFPRIFDVGVQSDHQMAMTTEAVKLELHAEDINGNIAEYADERYAVALSLIHVNNGSDASGVLSGKTVARLSEGKAIIPDLFIREVGLFSFRVSILDLYGFEHVALSSPVNITTGVPARLVLKQQPGAAFGGSPFRPPPVVAVADDFGNEVQGFEGTVLAVVDPSLVNSSILLEGNTSAMLSQGKATFPSLRISSVADDVVISFFVANASDNFSVSSLPFTVGIGPTHSLLLEEFPKSITAGEHFQVAVTLIDAGGNTNIGDSDSFIHARLDNRLFENTEKFATEVLLEQVNLTGSFTEGKNWVELSDYPESITPGERIAIDSSINLQSNEGIVQKLRHNPPRIRLLEPWQRQSTNRQPLYKAQSALTRPVQEGRSHFNFLRINLASRHYSIEFVSSLTYNSSLKGTLIGRGNPGFGKVSYGYGHGPSFAVESDTRNISISQEVEVVKGLPAQLFIEKEAGEAWQGGAPFLHQPVLSILDAGGNHLDTVTEGLVTAELLINGELFESADTFLSGTSTVGIASGLAEFRSLGIYGGGGNLSLYFTYVVEDEVIASVIQQHLVVSPSIETWIYEETAKEGDLFGSSISTDGQSLVVGATSSRSLVPSFQVVELNSSSSPYGARAVQHLQTLGSYQFQTASAVFDYNASAVIPQLRVAWSGIFSTRFSLSDPYEYIENLLKESLIDPVLQHGSFKVAITTDEEEGTKTSQFFLTARNIKAPVPPLSLLINESSLIQFNITEPAQGVGGEFQLGTERSSSSQILPYDVSANDMRSAVNALFNVSTVEVTRTGDVSLGTFKWRITFPAALSPIALLTVNSSQLTGSSVSMAITKVINGEKPLGGTFRLTVDGNGPSKLLPWNASDTLMEAYLKEISLTDIINVERKENKEGNNMRWIITFQLFPGEQAEPVIQRYTGSGSGQLNGADSKISIISSRSIQSQNVSANEYWPVGSVHLRDNQGAVFVYRKGSDQWVPHVHDWSNLFSGSPSVSHRLRGHDSVPGDYFGWDVALNNGTIAVGAPFSKWDKQNEVQSITCAASQGTFQLSWRDRVTEPIDVSISLSRLKSILEQSWVDASLRLSNTEYCDSICGEGDSACETFIEFEWPREGNLEPIVVERNFAKLGNNATEPTLKDDIVEGEIVSSGSSPSLRTLGSVYIYEDTGAGWVEVQKLIPPPKLRGQARTDQSLQCGHKILFDDAGTSLIMSCFAESTFGLENGGIHVFTRSDSSEFQYDHSLDLRPTLLGNTSMRCGDGMVLSKNTLIVSCPGPRSGRGLVLAFRRNDNTESSRWLLHQVLDAEEHTNFGLSIDISSDLLAVGTKGAVLLFQQPFHTGAWMKVGEVTSPLGKGSGLFGKNVQLSNNVLAVSTHQCDGRRFTERLMPIQEVCIEDNSGVFADSQPDHFSAHDKHTITERILADIYGGSFMLWIGNSVKRHTRALYANATANNVRTAIQEDLKLGTVNVERNIVNELPCWQITFIDHWRNYSTYEHHGNIKTDPMEPIPLRVQARLNSSFLQMFTRKLNKLLPFEMETVTIFRGTEVGWTWDWTAEALVAPNEPQICDGYGDAMKIHDSKLVIGASSRHRGSDHTKTGAVVEFDLSWLDVRFQSDSVVGAFEEHAGTANISIAKCSATCEHFSEKTETSQLFFQALPGKNWLTYDKFNSLRPPLETVTGLRAATTFDQQCGVNSTSGECSFVKIQYASSNHSGYDFLGLVDYVPTTQLLSFDEGHAELSLKVKLVDDEISELPGEYFHVVLHTPGLMPLLGGNYWRIIKIAEDDDGHVGLNHYLQRLYPNTPPQPFDEGFLSRFGSDLSMSGPFAFVGAPGTSFEGGIFVGMVYIFEKQISGWIRKGELHAPDLLSNDFSRYGAGVKSLESKFDKNVTWIVVGSPGSIAVAVTRLDTTEDAHLSIVMYPRLPKRINTNPQLSSQLQSYDRCGESGTLAIIDEKLDSLTIAMGCPGKSSVFLFELLYDNRTMELNGTQTIVLRSPDFRRYKLLEEVGPLNDQFGHQVKFRDGSLYVSAPYARLTDIPTESNSSAEIEDDSANTKAKSTGAVYQYFLADCEYYTTGNPEAVWSREQTIALASEMGWQDTLGWASPSVLEPQVVSTESNVCPAVLVNVNRFIDPSGHLGTGFGYSFDVSDSDLVIGAPQLCSSPDVSWDFEDGTLRGWTIQGRAFSTQPTYGDNVAFRPVYPFQETTIAYSSSAGVAGHYWIGTYENHSSVSVAQGTVQGDAPVGSLTSPPFVILGDSISFLLGGGCSMQSTFVQLIVDGVIEYRSTGRCSEHMSRTHWFVKEHHGRTGIIQIVDFGSFTPWGHINVDDFRFSWEIGKFTEVFGAGAAYAWQLSSPDTMDPECDANPRSKSIACKWELDQEFRSPDMRNDAAFGVSVSVNSMAKLLVVSETTVPHLFFQWVPFPGDSRTFSSEQALERAYWRTDSQNTVWFGDHRGWSSALRRRYSGSGWSSGWSSDGFAFSTVTDEAMHARRLTDQEHALASILDESLLDQGYKSRLQDLTIQANSISSTAGKLLRDLVRSPNEVANQMRASPSPVPSASTTTTARPPCASSSPIIGTSPVPTPTVLATLTPLRLRPTEWLDDFFEQVHKYGKDGEQHAKEESNRLFVFRKLSTVRGARKRFVRHSSWPSMFPNDIVSFPFYVAGGSTSVVRLNGSSLMIGYPEATAGSGWRDSGEVTFMNTDVLLPVLDMNAPNQSHEYVSNPFYNIHFQEYLSGALGLKYSNYEVHENVATGIFVLPVYVHDDINHVIHVSYATRDISAHGISKERFDYCLSLPITERGSSGCGQYEQKTGVLHFTPLRRERHIVIRIMDDRDVFESHPTRFAIHLFAPGGVILNGNQRSASVAIIDDDSK